MIIIQWHGEGWRQCSRGISSRGRGSGGSGTSTGTQERDEFATTKVEQVAKRRHAFACQAACRQSNEQGAEARRNASYVARVQMTAGDKQARRNVEEDQANKRASKQGAMNKDVEKG